MNTYTNIYTLGKNPKDTKNLRALDPLTSLNYSRTMKSNSHYSDLLINKGQLFCARQMFFWMSVTSEPMKLIHTKGNISCFLR